ncbi:hypothetical protein DPMN_044691 [Dreissena polymorpha]|uniref:Uncharacterized protein n=1 Tax=Dreissena polymorpha TaxID=45954 RepID=A0A9D4D4Z5_DREPO|nr:hypothetical protein DPMN_044691 [Dreissena polymorpha]
MLRLSCLSSHLIFAYGPIWDADQLSSGVSFLGEYLQLLSRLAHLLSIYIQVPAQVVSMPPSLPFSLGVPCERLPYRILDAGLRRV